MTDVPAPTEMPQPPKPKILRPNSVLHRVPMHLPFRHRCYWGMQTKIGWNVKNTFVCHLMNLPLSFTWTERDIDGVKRYIDALVADRVTEAKYFEERGFATNHVYPQHDPKSEAVEVRIDDFVDFLLLRQKICLPAHRRIHFFTDNERRKFVPSTYITSIAQLPGLEFLAQHADQDWHPIPTTENTIGGLKAEEVNTGLGLDHPDMSLADWKTASPPAPAGEAGPAGQATSPVGAGAGATPESEISRKAKDKHFELITYVRPRGAQPYFVKRLATYGGEMLWSGTSFQLEGPWTEYLRENALLIGLGIEP